MDFRLFSNDSFDLLKGGLNRVAIVGISRLCQGSENNSTITVSGDRDFAAEFKRFMGFAFGKKYILHGVREGYKFYV